MLCIKNYHYCKCHASLPEMVSHLAVPYMYGKVYGELDYSLRFLHSLIRSNFSSASFIHLKHA